jgi:RNA polymerase sigma-70 factor (ECF subfamily)
MARHDEKGSCEEEIIPAESRLVNPPDGSDDSALARQAQAGSTSAFGTLVHRHHGRVFAFLMAITRQRQDAEDLTQETFLRAWDKLHHYNPELPLLPWLLTLARRQSIAALRRSRPLRPDAMPEPPTEPQASSQALRLWELAKSQLPPAAYSALWLHYREDLPLKQVAAILGKREGAVKVLLHRARKTLAAKVATPPPLPASRHEAASGHWPPLAPESPHQPHFPRP